MIIYYQKSTGKILQVTSNKNKKHLRKKDDKGEFKKLEAGDLKFELNDMFPNLIDDVDVSVTEKNVKPECGGMWNAKKEEATPKPEEVFELTPEQERFVKLQNKFENQTATLKEVQEYLFLRDK